MKGTQQHIIRRKNLKVNANTSDALTLQRKISNLVNGEVLSCMGDMFDTLVNKHEWLIIEKLDIQLDNIREDELDTNFTDLLLRKLRAQIENKRDQIITGAVKDANPAVIISAREKAIQAFLFFLEKGILPWWYEISVHVDFEKEITLVLKQGYTITLSKPINYYSNELKRILSSEFAVDRLTKQFSEEVFETVINFLFEKPGAPANIVSLKTAMLKEVSDIFSSKIQMDNTKTLLSEVKSILLQKIVKEEEISEMLLGEWLSEIISIFTRQNNTLIAEAILNNKIFEAHIPREVKLHFKEADIIEKNLGAGEPAKIIKPSEHGYDLKREVESLEGVLVKNAGLVIVTPFLLQLFSECGILKENSITDIDKAIAILHYIVWGNLNYREYDTVLNKVICNVDKSVHINIVDEITPEEKGKVNELLRSVITHWDALKNTSPDGLREGFLQRRGKLNFIYDNWFLQVEQNTIDILLQSLPWTIGFIKLPWMKTMLRTEWH